MRKILAAAAITVALAAPAQAQFFWGSGPGWGMGGGWNNCANCGMRGYGAMGGLYSGYAGATNGFGRGMLGWGGIPSANGYGTGTNFGGFGAGMLGSMLPMPGLGMFGGGMGGGMGMMGGGGMGLLGMLGGLFMPGNYYPGAMGVPRGMAPPNGYAYRAARVGGAGSMGQMQYRQGGYGYSGGRAGPGYPYAQPSYGGGPNYRQTAYQAPPVQYIQQPRQPVCKIVSNGVAYTRVCY